MNWSDFNEMLWETFPWENLNYAYELNCPALEKARDGVGRCRHCHQVTGFVMRNPWKSKNAVLRLLYAQLQSTPRMCSRECLFNYLNDHYAEIIESITS